MTSRDNRGAAALRRIPGLKQADVIRSCSTADHPIDSAMVSRWWTGRRRPDPKFRAALQHEYGIGWQLWDEPLDPEDRADPEPEAPTGTS